MLEGLKRSDHGKLPTTFAEKHLTHSLKDCCVYLCLSGYLYSKSFVTCLYSPLQLGKEVTFIPQNVAHTIQQKFCRMHERIVRKIEQETINGVDIWNQE